MKVALYVRVSTAEQAKEGYSIGEQTERLKKYAESMGWTIYKIYTDGGYSGANIDRPALQELIEDIDKIDKVLVYKLDRLSRSQKDTLRLIEDVFLANKTDFISMNENFDTSTPFGKAMIGILSVFAQLEREQIKERMIMGKEGRAKEGKWKGGTCPIGYDYIDGQLVVNDFYTMQVKELFDLFNAGTPLRTIETMFMKKGYKTAGGIDWSTKQMRRTLVNRAYIGYLKYKNLWYKGDHEPIIDLETFETAQKIMEKRENTTTRGNKQTTCLGGLLYCAHCGGRYGKATSGGRNRKYIYNYACYSRHKKVRAMIKDENCKNKTYRIEDLDKIIFNEIKNLTSETIIKTRERAGTDNGKVIDKKIKEIDKQISRFLDLYGLGKYSVDQLDAKILPLEEQKKRLLEEKESIDKFSLDVDQALRLIESFDNTLQKGDLTEIRDIVHSLIRRIDIDNENISISWNFM